MEDNTVRTLKDSMKYKKNIIFKHVDADSLLLWKVSIPIDRLKKTTGDLELKDDDILMPDVKLSDIFSGQPNPDHLHIVVKDPSECKSSFSFLVRHLTTY